MLGGSITYPSIVGRQRSIAKPGVDSISMESIIGVKPFLKLDKLSTITSIANFFKDSWLARVE